MKTRGMIEVDTSQAEKLEQLYGRTVEGAMIVVFTDGPAVRRDRRRVKPVHEIHGQLLPRGIAPRQTRLVRVPIGGRGPS